MSSQFAHLYCTALQVLISPLSEFQAGTTFEDLDSSIRNAETQFGPRGDDWLTAYLFRKGEAIPEVCAHAPRTCEILRKRPEIGN